ncbi:MAG TPA: 23S rRNA (pseudouridine(1915)-N(3))-methyltransferase RlmH [Micropepsaceae bacterium]|nr:23S rRNA (pseudouridine(1915)-N(3))-methyltransferase RlmH [Micropepsaceae bacterium]
MRITVAAVGRGRGASEQGLCDLYWERAAALGPKLGISKFDFVIVDVSRGTSAPARMDEEAAKLARRLPTPSHHIALDEAGRPLSSEAFARHLAKLRDGGCRDLVFLIGGPDGLNPALKQAAQERLAFGPQTWPHLMVRAMLAEQIYRALAILSGHPYHRGRST